jgi:hypothetical protein
MPHNIWIERQVKLWFTILKRNPIAVWKIEEYKKIQQAQKKHIEEKNCKHEGESKLQNIETLQRIHYVRIIATKWT